MMLSILFDTFRPANGIDSKNIYIYNEERDLGYSEVHLTYWNQDGHRKTSTNLAILSKIMAEKERGNKQ